MRTSLRLPSTRRSFTGSARCRARKPEYRGHNARACSRMERKRRKFGMNWKHKARLLAGEAFIDT